MKYFIPLPAGLAASLSIALLLSGCGQGGQAQSGGASRPEASGGAGQSAGAGDTVPRQLALMADRFQDFQAEDETEWWAYAVTDLDQNGRLEVITSECHGTGSYTTTRIWEVNEALDGLAACQADENCGPVLEPQGGDTYTLSVYHDPGTGVYAYLMPSWVKDGAARYYESLRAVWLTDGVLSGEFLAYQDTIYDENGVQEVTRYDGSGAPLTQEAYETAAARRFEGLEAQTASVQWIAQVPMEELTGDGALLARLEASWQGFSIG